MKKFLFLALIAIVSFSACKTDGEAGTTTNAKSNMGKKNASYALGMSISTNLKKDSIPVDYSRLYVGLKDAMGGTMELTEAEVPELIQSYFQDTTGSADMTKISYAFGCSIGKNFDSSGLGDINVDEFKNGCDDVMNDKSLRFELTAVDSIVRAYQKGELEGAGAQFLAENAKKDGVKTTASGLQYKVLSEGTGKQPAATDQVTVHYTGTLVDGTKFDSSVDRGEPATFPLNGVIKGWTEGVQLMKEGAKYQLFIPYDLGYGERGAGAQIPPYSTLIFDIELIKVMDTPLPPPPPAPAGH